MSNRSPDFLKEKYGDENHSGLLSKRLGGIARRKKEVEENSSHEVRRECLKRSLIFLFSTRH